MPLLSHMEGYESAFINATVAKKSYLVLAAPWFSEDPKFSKIIARMSSSM